MSDTVAQPIFNHARMRRTAAGVFVADSVAICGDVTVGEETNIWPFVVARGDVAPIRIGKRCSVQDLTMLHCKHQVPLEIADDVLIGHHACVHCTSVGTWTLIGIGARVLDDATIGNDCIVAAGAVVPPGMAVPDGKVVAGVPAKIIRDIRPVDRTYIRDVLNRYRQLAADHASGHFPPAVLDTAPI